MNNDIPKVEIIFITYNRLYYTKLTLPKLLNCSYNNFSVTIVDNASIDGTIGYLKKILLPLSF